MQWLVNIACVVAVLPCATGHGALQMPPTWHDPDGSIGMSPGTQCNPGCIGKQAQWPAQGCMCEWYTNWTFISGEATIPDGSPLITYKNACHSSPLCDWTKTHPWRAPGSAPIFSPCGHDGGNPDGCPVGNPSAAGCGGGGYGHGPDARALKGNTKPTEWVVGSTVETAWGITANHGGGYQYRLCMKPASGNMALTEECFQKTPLRFAGAVRYGNEQYAQNTQWVQYGKDPSTRQNFTGMLVALGTVPLGSLWMRNPIPACAGTGGGSGGAVCSGPQFPPPLPGLYGFGNPTFFKWSIVDKVEVPADLPLGDYVLSFRWDCEQTPQVWNSCSDVRIVKGQDGIHV